MTYNNYPHWGFAARTCCYSDMDKPHETTCKWFGSQEARELVQKLRDHQIWFHPDKTEFVVEAGISRQELLALGYEIDQTLQ
jgi:hypothetical protein